MIEPTVREDQPEDPIPDRFQHEELVARLLNCIDECVGDMNVTATDIIGSLEIVKLKVYQKHFIADEEDEY